MKLSQWGFLDATMPVAKFARARMAERLGGPNVTGDPKRPLLPVTADGGVANADAKSVDLLTKFLAARDARPEFMTEKLVQTMAVSMAFAGSETTAISLAAVFYYLLRNPARLARLRREIDGAARRGLFSDHESGLVTWTESQKLPYLDACVKEAFRMHPAAGLPLERIVPQPGAEIAGHQIRGGTIVGCSAWIIHRRPEIWGDDVDVYRPERWLVEDDEEVRDAPMTPEERTARERHVREMNGMMFQFGMGSRTCIGKNISLLEIYKVVPSLLRRFDVSDLPFFSSRLHNHPTLSTSLITLQSTNAQPPKKQISFKDPNQEWKLVNAWFVKQNNFQTVLALRDIVMPEGEGEKASPLPN